MRGKLIFSPIVSKKLLKMGNVIIDIKPKKENINESIFVFEYTEKLQSDIISINSK